MNEKEAEPKNKSRDERYFAYWQRGLGEKDTLKDIVLFVVIIVSVSVFLAIFIKVIGFEGEDYIYLTSMIAVFVAFLPTYINITKTAYKTKNKFLVLTAIQGWIGISLCLIGGVLLSLKSLYGWIVIGLSLILIIYLASKEKDTRIRFLNTFYRNIIVRAGEEIDSMTDGFSQRPFSKKSENLEKILNGESGTHIAKDFGITMGKDLIFVDWKVKDDGEIIYFIPCLSTKLFRWDEILWNKKNTSFIKVNRKGDITVSISKMDYKKILEPVAYHILCRNVAEKFERSFIEFAKGDNDSKINAIKILKGEK